MDPEGLYGSEGEDAEGYDDYYSASESEWNDADESYDQEAYTEDEEYTDEDWALEEYEVAESYLACNVVPSDEDERWCSRSSRPGGSGTQGVAAERHAAVRPSEFMMCPCLLACDDAP